MDTEATKRQDYQFRKNKKSGYVYLFSAVGGFYKIGASKNPNERLLSFAFLPFEIKIAHAIKTDDAAWLESFYHQVFADKHIVGEWFKLTPEDVAAITIHTDRAAPICGLRVIAKPAAPVVKIVAPITEMAARIRREGLGRNRIVGGRGRLEILAEAAWLDELKCFAAREGVALSSLVRLALNDYLRVRGIEIRTPAIRSTAPKEPKFKRQRGRPRKDANHSQ